MPGTSGVLSPFCKIKGLTFNESVEPDNFMYEYYKDLQDELDSENCVFVNIDTDDKEEYYDFLRQMHKFNQDQIVIDTKLKNEDEIIFEESELDLTNNKNN